jgi:hypothetical protein
MPSSNSARIAGARPRRSRQAVQATAPLVVVPRIHLVDQARRLALESDVELQHGHIARAEHLARQAAALRGWGA